VLARWRDVVGVLVICSPCLLLLLLLLLLLDLKMALVLRRGRWSM